MDSQIEENNSGSGIQKLTDSLETVITGIPAPVRKNFFKAFSQLCTAAVDIPVAFLEGKASEIRALTEARIQIINKEGKSISQEVLVPQAYISKASNIFASKIIREQLNLDQITLNAANELLSNVITDEKTPESEINEEWLNEFENHARLKSSDDMRLIFGKILSGEILKPGTFSIRTIKLVSQLDKEAAQLFQVLCSVCISIRKDNHIYDARVISFNGEPGSNSLIQFGLSFLQLNILQEFGLISPEYNSFIEYWLCISAEDHQAKADLGYNNKQYHLVPTDKEKYDKKLRLSGVVLTTSGKELLDVVPHTVNASYRKLMFEYFEKKHLKLIEITN